MDPETLIYGVDGDDCRLDEFVAINVGCDTDVSFI